jgi:hypothetical protein
MLIWKSSAMTPMNAIIKKMNHMGSPSEERVKVAPLPLSVCPGLLVAVPWRVGTDRQDCKQNNY